MDENTQSKFLRITLNEMKVKLSVLCENRAEIKIWRKGVEPSLYTLSSFEDGVFRLDGLSKFSEDWKSQKVYINFIFKNIDYFTKATFVKEEGDFLFLKPEVEFYRHEKREGERLLTYPHHNLYAYFKFLKDEVIDKSNVISFNSHRKGEDGNVFREFIKERDKVMDIDQELGEVRGFRLSDISSIGMSFLIRKSDEHFFIKDDEGIHLGFTLVFNGESFSIKSSKVIYIVDFVDPKIRNASMLKIGVKFDNSDELSTKIDSIIMQSNQHSGVIKEIESFEF